MINIDPKEGVLDIIYRQWTKRHSFVTGVDFSDTDSGIVIINKTKEKKELPDRKITGDDFVGRHYTNRFNESLRTFSTQPLVWVEPVLNKVSEVSVASEPEQIIEPNIALSDFISHPTSTIIKAPPEFGQTCLAHYLCKEAWYNEGEIWVYLNSNDLKINSIEKSVQAELQLLALEQKDIKCIVLDLWKETDKRLVSILQRLCTLYQDIPIVVMEKIENNEFLLRVHKEEYPRKFDILYLWQIPRASIRKLVNEYNNERNVGEVDRIIEKITSDLEVLNLPRTALNCLTLLKVSEVDFDESPVNRAELINRILFILFNMDSIPTYKVRPDLKDCEYVLGYFCETMIRENMYLFTRDKFLRTLQTFCKEKIIDLDIDTVFEILYQNNILIEREGSFCFRFSFWIFYFTAQRMYHDKDFANFILQDMNYASYPEIIEFYTGIDRRREDALQILTSDIKSAATKLEDKLRFPKDLNIYEAICWSPPKGYLEEIHNKFVDNLKSSQLPNLIKDQYADRNYDKTRPYHQEIQTILQEFSLAILLSITSAGARALRNSDYANPDLKGNLLDLITQSLDQISKVLIAFAPILAKEGFVSFEGVKFYLSGDFSDLLFGQI